jgi:hypothetical protein
MGTKNRSGSSTNVRGGVTKQRPAPIEGDLLMQRLLKSVLLFPLFAFLPILAEAQDAKDAKTAPKAEAKFDDGPIRASMLKKDFIQGRLKAYKIDGDDKRFTVEAAHQVKKLNLAMKKRVDELAYQMRVAFARGDKQKAEQIRMEGLAAYEKMYDVTDIPIVFEFVGPKTMVYRTMEAPIGDDGKPKTQLTPEEFKLYKGDAKLPGYIFSPDKLDVDMIVQVFIDKAKYKPDAPPAKEAKTTSPPVKETKPSTGVKIAAPPPPPMPETPVVTYPTNMLVIVPITDNSGGGNPFLGGGTAPPKGKNKNKN